MTNSTLTLRARDIPAIHRFGIGFDTMIDELLRLSSVQQSNYPPYNLLKIDEDVFNIEIAVAGFKEGEIEVTIEKNVLTVKGAKKDGIPENIEYVHHGISTRNFERTFPLAEHIEVKGAIIRDGMLVIDLVRIIPEDEKPKSIAISYVK
jgi:molecular chaperone IbpA